MKTKVYYADTDAGGVVYYGSYLRWLEMARCDWLEELGMPVAELARKGFVFAIARVEIDYRRSAVLGDEVEVTVRPVRVRHVRFILEQNVLRCTDGEVLASAKVTLACLTPQGKVTVLPEPLAAELARHV